MKKLCSPSFYVLFTIGLFFLTFTELHGAALVDYAPVEDISPEEHLEILRDGVLIVRIPTYSAQIRHLSESINKSKKEEKYLRKQLASYKERAQKIKVDAVEAFANDYDYSEVYFIMDTAMTEFLKDYNIGRLYNPEGKDLKPFDKESILFCIEGNTSQYGNGNKSAWLIMNHNMERLPSGFPYYVGERNVIQSIFSIFSSVLNERYKRSMVVIAGKFNQQFYKKSGL